MSTNRVTTRSKNATQHPGLIDQKQLRRTNDEVAALREAKEEAKNEKERTKKRGIKRVAAFEKQQADDDTMEQTPKAVIKPRPLVRTRSYADVLRGDDVDMVSVSDKDARPNTVFKVAHIGDGQTTESDGMETAVEQAPPKKKMKVSKTERKGKSLSLRDAIKAVQDSDSDTPEKSHKHAKASNSDSMEIDATPKPSKNFRKRVTESDDDLPAAPTKRRVAQPTMPEEGESEDQPSKTKRMEKNKGKGKQGKPAGKSKATGGADQIRGSKVPKSVIFPILSASILSHVFTDVERNDTLLLLP
jgi:hypothetical protein